MEPAPVPPEPQGSLPDAETADAIYLVKNVSFLRATRQIRLLAFKAARTGKTLVLLLPPSCRLDPALEGLVGPASGAVRRENL